MMHKEDRVPVQKSEFSTQSLKTGDTRPHRLETRDEVFGLIVRNTKSER